MKLTLPWFVLFSFSLVGLANSETITIDGAQLRWVDNVRVGSRDAGIVMTVAVKPNDVVEQQTLLVELESEVQTTEADAAEKQLAMAIEQSSNDVNLRFAEKSSEVVKKELDRARAAVQKYSRAVSQTEMEKKQLELEQVLLSGEQARHELSIAKLNTQLRESERDLAKIKLKQRSITSPLAGEVAEVYVQEGEWLDLGAPVLRIVNSERLRVVALVPEAYLFSIKNGQMASLKVSIGAKENELTANGKVSFVSPEINPVDREFMIWVDIDNKQKKLRPGLVGSLTIEAEDRK